MPILHPIRSEFTPVINRRMLGALALGAMLSACGGGSDSTVAPPTIATEPQDVHISEGEVVRFSVTAQGEGPVGYQWFRDGVAIAGATEQTLELPAIRRTDSGALFSVAVRNAAGAVQSRPALLKVEPFGEVVASKWSDKVPSTGELNPNASRLVIAVGASGLVYVRVYENEGFVLKRYQPDGSGVETFLLPRLDVRTAADIAVVEDPSTGDVLIARALSVGVSINVSDAVGGAIYRFNPRSGQLTTLFESDSITPSGLARDRAGNLYTVDIKTGDVLQLSQESNQLTALYKVNVEPKSPSIGIGGARGVVAVTDDGTVYATVIGYAFASLSLYNHGEKILRLRQGKADLISVSNTELRGWFSSFVAYGNSVFFLTYANGTSVLRKLDASGKVFLIAGTIGAQDTTQFGSPGVLSKTTEMIGLTPDGRVHLESKDASGPKFFDVVLPAESAD